MDEAREISNEMRHERASLIAKDDASENLKKISVVDITDALNECTNNELLELLSSGFKESDTSKIGTAIWRICYFYEHQIAFDIAMDNLDGF